MAFASAKVSRGLWRHLHVSSVPSQASNEIGYRFNVNVVGPAFSKSRATVALMKAAQASALLDGRSFATPDDVKGLAPAVLRHRVAVAPELELEGVSADAALASVIERVEAPG